MRRPNVSRVQAVSPRPSVCFRLTLPHFLAAAPEALLKTLPNGISEGQNVSIVRRPSSTRSRSSVSSAAPSPAPGAQRTPGPSGATSTASVSDQELATVGRKKSLSRPNSSSRRSSSARDKKPHDLAHGHLADHPTHVSAVYSPYPQHVSKEHHHSHHHLPPGPSPLSKGAERKSSTDLGGQRRVKTEAQPAVPPLPSASTLTLPNLPSLAPTPPRSNSAPTPHTVNEPASSSSSPLPPPAIVAPKPTAPLTTEQLASAYFFRDLTPQTEAVPTGPAAASTATTDPAMQAYFEAPVLGRPSTSPSQQGDVYGAGATLMIDEPLPFTAADVRRLSASPTPSLPGVDPAAAAFVLGPASSRPAVSLAPMFGEGEGDAVFQEVDQPPAFSSVNEGPLYSFAGPPPSSSATPVDAWAQQDYPAPSSSAASSDVFDLQGGRRPSSALYGYPLEPVASHTLSSYSSASASGAQSLSATSALERLDLDFDLDPERNASATGYLSSASHSAQATSPHAPFEAMAQGQGQGQAQQATDLDGILEWLASAQAGPPPLQHTDSGGTSSSGLHSAWPSAPPSVYGGASGQEENGEAAAPAADGAAPPQDESPPAPGPSGASRVAFGALPVPRGAEPADDSSYPSRPGSAFAPYAPGDGVDEEEEDDEGEPRGDNDLEMLRTATITCCDPSASASASHSSDEGGWADGAGGASGAIDEPFSLADLDLERFGVDEAWLRSLGLFGGPPEGEGDEDDGYEEDDEASVTGNHREEEGASADHAWAEDHRGWTEDDFAWPPARPDPDPPDQVEAEEEDVEVKEEPSSGDDFAASVSAADRPGVVKAEDADGERDRDEQGFNRGELWWS